MTARRKMTVTMEVTDAQALGLEAMFAYWNMLGAMGCSRAVSFMVDGDGNFKPKCTIEYPEGKPITPLSADDVHTLAFHGGNDTVERHHFDFDAIGWALAAEESKTENPHLRCYRMNVRPPEKRALIDQHLADMTRLMGKASVLNNVRTLLDDLERFDPECIPTFRLMVLAKKLFDIHYIDAFRDPR